MTNTITEADLPPPLHALFLLLGRVALVREMQYQDGGGERYRAASKGLIRAAETLNAVVPATFARLAAVVGRIGADAMTALALDTALAAGIETPPLASGEAFVTALANLAEGKSQPPPGTVH